MSISSEIARITNAKNAIATAISNKGVTVPSGAKIEDMPALIDDISGGGGVETCTLTITTTEEPGGDNDSCVYATTPDGAQTYYDAGTYTILKNSVLGTYSSWHIQGSYQELHAFGLIRVYKATGNLTVQLIKGF